MSGTSVDLRGKEQVLSHYEFRATPFYAVYCGKDLKFYHVEDDQEKGQTWLDDNLTMIAANGSTAIHKIEFYETVTDKKKLVKENLMGVVTFRLNPVGDSMGGSSWDRGGAVQAYKSREMELLEKIVENQTQLQSRVQALETDGEDDTEETPGSMGMKMISGIMDQPEVQRAFAQRLLGFIDSIMPVKNTQMQQSGAGIGNVSVTAEDIDQMNNSIQILLNNGMTPADLQLLANLCTGNKAQFDMLLGMLRAQMK